jgi:hypothetical protein
MNEVRIMVCERGFVLVGRPREHPTDPLFLIVDDCTVVRIWGTTKGLGELAAKGPLSATVLDPEGDGVLLNKRCVYRSIPCTGKAWAKWSPSN